LKVGDAMSQKKFFVVGYPSSGTTLTAVDLLNYFRDNNQSASLQTLGFPAKVANFSKILDEQTTIQKINNFAIDHQIEENLIFVGWLIPKHLSAIYQEFQDSAAFIFCQNTSTDLSLANFLKTWLTAQELEDMVNLQKSTIDAFVASAGLNLNWTKVSRPFINQDKSLSVDPTSNLEIAIVGSL